MSGGERWTPAHRALSFRMPLRSGTRRLEIGRFALNKEYQLGDDEVHQLTEVVTGFTGPCDEAAARAYTGPAEGRDGALLRLPNSSSCSTSCLRQG
ncbi:MAG TPA: hypothetical protein VIY07_14135 [Pseudolabrys sp.]